MSRESYRDYLNSPTWKRLRQAALKRDGGRCKSCGAKAIHVHHARYPKVLGEERPETLHSLCVPCHEEIHRLVREDGLSLRIATRRIIANDRPVPKRRKAKKKKKQVTHGDVVRLKRHLEKPRPKVNQNTKLKMTLKEENDRLHQVAVNRRRREAAKKGSQ